MNNQPIGILDSGVGGLSIWQEIVQALPHESIVYVADAKHCPYGTKTPAQILSYVRRIVKKLIAQDVKLIVIACNTATVYALAPLRKEFPSLPIIGIVPVVKTAAERTKKQRIGILSTSATAKSTYQKRLIAQYAGDCKVISVGTDDIVPLIEKGHNDCALIKKKLKKILVPFIKADVDVIALGCSHFPLIRDQIQEIVGPEVLLLDPGGAVARHTHRILIQNNALTSRSRASYAFFTTGDAKQFAIIARELVRPELAPYIRRAVTLTHET